MFVPFWVFQIAGTVGLALLTFCAIALAVEEDMIPFAWVLGLIAALLLFFIW